MQSKEPHPLIHPTMVHRYRKAVVELREALKERQSGEAREHVGGLIEKIVLTPKPGQNGLAIDLHGDLAGILTIAAKDKIMKQEGMLAKRLGKKAVNDNFLSEPVVQLVAGASNQHYLPLIVAHAIITKLNDNSGICKMGGNSPG